ncbi:MAG: RIP metalloprotease RseP [Burkholderiales bacterium]|jgi:regulator of sigma E protease|nr:RIP metalloprotease RseP [Burkholderiales bacterium]
MSALTTLVAFVVTLGVLIVIHEFGHYWVARRCGVRVLRFSIGFGRPLWKKVYGADRTEWVVAAVPLGGYVRMLDERDPDTDPALLADLSRAFNRQPVAKRIAIVLAGPLANLLLAVGVYWLLNVSGTLEPRAVLGPPAEQTIASHAGVRDGDEVVRIDGRPVRAYSDLRWKLLERAVDRAPVELTVRGDGGAERTLLLDLSRLGPGEIDQTVFGRLGVALAEPPPVVRQLVPDSVAAVAGLRPGDRFVSIDGQPMARSRDVSLLVRAAPGRTLQVVIERDGQRRSLQLQPAAVQAEEQTIGRIGVDFRDLVEVRYGPFESVGLAVERTWDTAIFSLRMLGKMITGEASWKNLSGPVTIADYAGQTARMGVVAYLSFLALVSISLGVLNLLPIPMLDGGHLLYYLVEILKGSPPADWVVEWGQRAGIGVLVLLTALALYNDLTRLLA